MIIYGVSKNYYSQAILSGSNLLIEEVIEYHSDLDLFMAITSSNSPWGLNFSFSISSAIYPQWGVSNWAELLSLALFKNRLEFLKLCQEINLDKNQIARFIDLKSKIQHPLQKHNAKTHSDFYGNLRFLAHLKQLGVSVYPFDEFDKQKPRIYEIGIEEILFKIKMRKISSLGHFIDKFNALNLFKVQIPDYFLNNSNTVLNESILTCIILAIYIKNFKLEENWDKPLENQEKKEWSLRILEGLALK